MKVNDNNDNRDVVTKSAYKKANSPEFPKNILDFSTDELKTLLITCDGIGKSSKQIVFDALLLKIS